MKQMILAAIMLFGCRVAEAALIQWPESLGGNNHYYEAITEEISWTDADSAASGKSFLGVSGHLATVTSAAENQFLVDNFETFHLWLGGYQFDKLAEPAGHWRWVTDEPWGYTNWLATEPNESGGPEDFLVFGGDNSPEGVWQDWKVFGDFPRASRFDPPLGYIVEYDVVPEPATYLLFMSGLVGLLRRRNRRDFK